MSSKPFISVKNTDQNSKPGGSNTSDSAMTALHALKRVTCSTPRRLSESEIKLLRQAKLEISQIAKKCLQTS